VHSFQLLSRRISVAIDSEQTRCQYFSCQAAEMVGAHDEVSESKQRIHRSPFAIILDKCGLAQTLNQVFEDLTDCGTTQVLINDWIEMSMCIEPRALLYAGLTPRSRSDIERTVSRIRPYHGLLVLRNCGPLSVDASPDVRLVLAHTQPNLSLLRLSSVTGLPLMQILYVVRHLLLWAQAVIIYPLCNSNVYTSAVTSKPCLSRVTERFSEAFPDSDLADLLAEFNPPATLGDFVNPQLYDSAHQKYRTQMVIHMLREQLLMQLHSYVYLIAPMSDSNMSPCSTLRPSDEVMKRLIELNLEENLQSAILFIYGCQLENNSDREEEMDQSLLFFLRLVPYLNGEHHLEDIMHNENAERSLVLRVLDTYGMLLASFYRPDNVFSE